MIWILLAACSRDADPGDSAPAATTVVDHQRDVVGRLVDGYALRHYRDLQLETAALVGASAAFCAAPDDAGLAALRAAWWDAHAPWKRAELMRFGPATDEPYRLQPKIDTWPPNPAAIYDYLSGDGGFAQADFDLMGTATRGFPALEVVLWEPGEGTLAAFEADPRRCAYAVGLAGDLDVLAGRMVAAWEEDWRERLVHPEDHPDDAYETMQDVVDEWVNRMIFTVEDIRSTKLGKPAGDSSGGEPLPDTIESRYSGRSLQDARDALAGVKDVADGGILELLPAETGDVPRKFAYAHDQSTAFLASVMEPLEVAIVADIPSITATQDRLLDEQVVLQVDLAQALSVTLAFNDNDGD